MMVYEERREQTAPSPMPVIKPAVGGRVWERGREDVKRAGSGLPPSGVTSTMQGKPCKGLCFMSFSSAVIVWSEQDCAMVSFTGGDRNPIHLS